jgi:hypothetical protein
MPLVWLVYLLNGGKMIFQMRKTCAMFMLMAGSGLLCQVAPPTSGEITVKLTQGLDSSADPNGISQGRVTKSTNPVVPVGTNVTMSVVADSGSGGYIVKLTDLAINGKTIAASSSDIVAAPDFFNKALEKTRAQGQPQDAVKGRRVFLPQNMIVRFTLAEPSAAGSTPQATASNRVRPGPTSITPTSPSVGPVGGQTFNPQTAPNIRLPAIDALAARSVGGSATVAQVGLESGFSTFNARENIILKGAIQPPPPGFFHGMRMTRLNPGTVVKITDVRGMDDGEHDILHVLLEDDSFPTFTNVAFVFPKGTLSTLSEPTLEKVITPFFSLPTQRNQVRAATPQTGGDTATGPQYLYVLEGIGLRMSLDQVRAAVKTAGSVRGLIKQGPTTYNVRTRDLTFQVEFDEKGRVYQYNVSALNPRHLKETEHSGPLYDTLSQAFGPSSSWGKPVVYDLGEGTGAYAIVSDPAHFQ